MKTKKRVKLLEAKLAEMEKIISKNSITLTDNTDENLKVVISLSEGNLSTDKIIASTTKENITNQN